MPLMPDAVVKPLLDKAEAPVGATVKTVSADDALAVKALTPASPPLDKAPNVAEVMPVTNAAELLDIPTCPYIATVHVEVPCAKLTRLAMTYSPAVNFELANVI